MECEIVIRAAKEQDKPARSELIEKGITCYDLDAIMHFVFQELTLQLSVLCSAVMFIFVGASLVWCALVPFALSVITAVCVLLGHRAIAQQQSANMKLEEAGFVAEYRGPLGGDSQSLSARIVTETDSSVIRKIDMPSAYVRLIGTISLSEYRGPTRSGWLHGFAVHPQWRQRGVSQALLTACRSHAIYTGLESLEAALSMLQANLRTLLHSNGWELRNTYHRRLLGDAITLPMMQLGLDLPHA